MRRFLFAILADQEYRLSRRAVAYYHIVKPEYLKAAYDRLFKKRRWRLIAILKAIVRASA